MSVPLVSLRFPREVRLQWGWDRSNQELVRVVHNVRAVHSSFLEVLGSLLSISSMVEWWKVGRVIYTADCKVKFVLGLAQASAVLIVNSMAVLRIQKVSVGMLAAFLMLFAHWKIHCLCFDAWGGRELWGWDVNLGIWCVSGCKYRAGLVRQRQKLCASFLGATLTECPTRIPDSLYLFSSLLF